MKQQGVAFKGRFKTAEALRKETDWTVILQQLEERLSMNDVELLKAILEELEEIKTVLKQINGQIYDKRFETY